MYFFRLATAGQVLPLGAFVSSSDGFTVVSTGTMANTDIKIQKHNSTAEVSKNSGGGTHISGGRWYCTLDATDTSTAGRLTGQCSYYCCDYRCPTEHHPLLCSSCNTL